MIEQHIYTALSGTEAITALTSTNIFPLVLPEEPTLPAITYSIIAVVTDPTFDTAGLNKYRVQIDCRGGTYLQATSLRDAVIATVNGYTDASITAWMISVHDGFDHDLMQYIATIDFYILSAL